MTFAPFDGPLEHRPKNLAEVIATFGDPGVKQLEPLAAWAHANIVECHEHETGPRGRPPMPGATAQFYFQCHRLAEPYMREALARCEQVAAGHVKRAASFVFRHMRHRVDLPLSYHSWGIAIDINSSFNEAHEFAHGAKPKLWSPEWCARWPHGVTEAIVDAFKSCGFAWGGDWAGYCDPMHFELKGATDVQV